ncbi:Rib/alpha-like domain-containing protein [Corynebacterium afermentans]|uniref:Rib/alpha-like domain-containing protein n=1 Tax=Corynebacterium afermentans TaxID=38286 RepID=UPI0025734B69|nr:Rib/alpha-like domain-containing protein [Corynebacterium afermentans]
MKKNYNARRRGTSVAAAALSFALVAPMAQSVAVPGSATSAFASTKEEAGQANAKNNGVKYPGENADGIYQTSVGEPRYTFEPGPAKHNAIESGTTQDDTDSIQGFVLNHRNGNMSVHPGTKNYRPIPMEGVRVYAEWVDKDGYTSPTYTTVTGPDGRYAIKMRSFVDALGQEHTFDADPNLPEGEKIRVWADNPDGETFQQVYGYNNGFLGPQANDIDTQGAATGWEVGPNRVNDVRFFYGEKPQNEVMHKLDQAVENPKKSSGQGGQVQGKAFWEQDHTQGAFTWNLLNTLNSGDVAAEGLKVYGSYLSDYAINKIMTEAPADLGVDEIRKGTRNQWSRDDEAALQNWIKREMAADTEKDPVTGKFGKDRWIAETVMATVGADNNYTLQFNGTFGEDEKGDRGTGGVARNPLNRNDGTTVAFPDGSEHVAWDLLGTVAPDSNYGTFRKGALGNSSDKMPKHVNWDWLFVSTEDVPGFGVQTPWQTNGYLDVGAYNTNDGWNVAKIGEHLNTAFLSLYADYVTFDVTPYDSAENWAKPGEVAETDTKGVPTEFVNNLKYEIEWVNADTGEVVDTSDPMKADANGELPSFPLDTGDAELFPDGIDKTTTFRADLYPVDVDEDNARGSRIAADSFTVLVGWAPVYEETEGAPGEPLKSGEPVFDNTTTDEEEKEKGSDLPSPVKSYEIPDTFQVPDGYTVDLNEETGEVTVTFPEDTEPGTEFNVPVRATLEDGTKTVGSADFKVADVEDAEKYDPEGQDQTVQQGETPDPKNNIKDADKLPDGTEFEYDEAPDTSTPGEKPVTVTVTYPDGSTDTVETTVTVADPEKSDADNYTPTPNVQEVPLNDTPDAKGSIGNADQLPEGTEFEYDEAPDTSTTGEKPVTVIVTYPDDSTDTVETTVKVTSDADKNNPQGQNQNVKAGETPDPKNNIKDADQLPDGTTFEYAEDPDTSESGKQDVTVVVTYPDGSTDEVPATVTVTDQASEFDPRGQRREVPLNSTPEAKDSIDNADELPEGTEFEFKETPDTSTTGDKPVTVVVTYPDGSSEEVTTSILVVSQADKIDPEAQSQEVDLNSEPDPKNNIQNPDDLPEGTTFEYAEEPDTSTPGTKDVTVKVTYPDGSVDEVDSKIVVKEPAAPDATQAETFDPNYEELTQVTVDGDKATNNPFGEEDAPLKNIDSKASDGSQDWEFQMQENGVIVATAPTMAEVGEAVGEQLPTIDKSWEKFVETFTPYARPTVTVDFTYEDDSKDEGVDANFDLLGKDGKSLLDPDGDFDDDGFSNKEEIEKGTNPADETSKPSEGDDVKDTTPPTVNPITEGDKTVSGTGDRPNEKIIVELPGGQKVETETDKDGNWTIDVPADVELKPGDKVIVSDGAGNKSETTVEADEVKDTTPPTVNPIKPGDKTISGTGDRPNEEIIVELPGGQKVETTTDENGKWTIEVPAGVELKPGDKVIVSDGAGNETTAQVGIDTGKCVATSLGFGLPLLALIPLGLASQMEIPGLSNVVADANAQLQAANTRIQQQLGLFNPGIAAQVDAANRQLAQFGTDLGTVAGGLALIAAGILAGTLIYDNCSPNGGGSSVKDLQLKGSSGKTYAGSSKKDGKDAESGSSKKDDKTNEQAADKK